MSDITTDNSLPESGKEAKTEQEGSFAELLERSSMGGRLAPGQRVKAKVVSVSGDLVFIDLGGKSEGAVNLSEFTTGEGAAAIREGDEIEAFFVTVQDGLMKLTTLRGGYSAATLDSVRDAHEAGIPVNGEVKRETRGGFEVSVGGVRCFCPFSQIDLRGRRDSSAYIGQTFPFKVIEYGEEGKTIVLSRKNILEQERQARIEKLRESLSVGMTVNAEVKSIQNFGAFVDLGGIDGLIPASEISWDRSLSVSNALSVGKSITAKVIALDWESSRFTLSMKAAQPDPWMLVPEKYPVGSRVQGTVVRLFPFGAFLRIEPGVEGLIHISNLGAGRRINHPKEVIQEGQELEVYVLAVDHGNKKISLSVQPKAEPLKVTLPGIGDILDGTVERVMPYGIFLKMGSGLTGLIPNSETGTPPGTDLKKIFPPGTEMRIVVADVDTANNKVRLSRKAVLDKVAQEEFDQYRESAQNFGSSSGSFGSLGEILRAKLEEKTKKV